MKASRGEIKIYEILKSAELNFKEEYSIAGLNSPNGRPLRFDFALFPSPRANEVRSCIAA